MGILDDIFGGGKSGKTLEKSDWSGHNTGKSYEREKSIFGGDTYVEKEYGYPTGKSYEKTGDRWMEKEQGHPTGKMYHNVGGTDNKLVEEDMSGHSTGRSYRRVGDKLIED